MKIKEKAFAILLSMVMILTFMPALAFAEGEEADAEGTLVVGEEMETPEAESEAMAEESEDSFLDNAEQKLSTQEGGEDDEVYWTITESDPDEYYSDDSGVTLNAFKYVSYDGDVAPILSYKWYHDADPDGQDYAWEVLEGENGPTLAVPSEFGYYKCDITDGYENSDLIIFTVQDINNAEPEVEYPDATATFIPADDGELIYDIRGDETNFPGESDIIAVEYEGRTHNYQVDINVEDGRTLVNTQDSTDTAFFYLNHEDGTVFINIYKDSAIGEGLVFDISIPVEATIIDSLEDVKSIEFSPSGISLYSEDIKEVDDGKTIYSFGNRAKTTYPDGTSECLAFAKGDKLTVHYENGSTVLYTATVEYDQDEGKYDLWFTDNDGNWIWPEYYEGDGLKAGDNKVEIAYGPATTTISVYLDTPEARAQRKAEQDRQAAAAAEATRQGTFIGGLPKVKISKPKAAKKSATIKWKKLNKKQLKKGVTNIEVWVCPNGAFGPNDTIMKTTGKKKASLKVKGLAKGTYFVKVRAIKNVGGVKYYSAWSKVKKVKIKK